MPLLDGDRFYGEVNNDKKGEGKKRATARAVCGIAAHCARSTVTQRLTISLKKLFCHFRAAVCAVTAPTHTAIERRPENPATERTRRFLSHSAHFFFFFFVFSTEVEGWWNASLCRVF